ncbi:MAG TPA: glycosyltransferase family 39 protein [Pirellulales bacterium]|nr:glycosyltransferase family 39 protein [Pirellulales bacterium]
MRLEPSIARRSPRRPQWPDYGWLLVCLALSSGWCWTAARQLSATFDEPLYVARGLERWRTGSHAGLMRLGTMPLPIDCDTLPLYLYEQWTGTPIDPVADLAWALPWARTTGLVFWWLLLVYGWLAGRTLAGAWGGRLAVAWLACEPNLLAHASLATTDIAISACLLALIYHFRTGRQGDWKWRVGVPGLWFGAALLAKASGMVFGPLCMIVVEVEKLLREHWQTHAAHGTPRSWWDSLRSARPMNWLYSPPACQFRRDLIQIVAIGFIVAFLYCGCDWRAEPSFVAWAHKLPDGPPQEIMVWISEHLQIFSNAGEGLVRQVKHNLRGHHGAYLLGETYARPVWYYFPLALAIKLSLPLLLAPVVVLMARRRALANWAGAAAFVLLLFSFNCRVQIGIRLVLPLIVLVVVAVATGLVTAAGTSSMLRRRLLGSAAVAAIAWTAFTSWRVWPEALCYTNELWGGTSHGYLCLSDSNYDWGQGVKELAQWWRQRGVEPLDVWYFGTDPAAAAPPLRLLPLHILPLQKPDDVRAFAQGRYLAVGTTLLYGTTTLEPGHRQAVEFFRGRQPVDRTSTFLIYDLDEPLARRTRVEKGLPTRK